MLRVDVRDHGIGLRPARLRDKLFQPFQRLHGADESGQTSLAIAQRIAERHGGRISARSEPGRARPSPSNFRPETRTDAQGNPAGRGQSRRRRADPHRVRGGQGRPPAARGERRRRGARLPVRAASTPTAIRPACPRWCCSTSTCPKLDGREVLQAIRANEATRMLPVVVLTTSAEPFDVDATYAPGSTATSASRSISSSSCGR